MEFQTIPSEIPHTGPPTYIGNISFLKDVNSLDVVEVDQNIRKFLLDTAKNFPNDFKEQINTTDLFYRPLTLDDLFIKEVSNTWQQNTILSYLILSGRKATGAGFHRSPDMFLSFLNQLEFFFGLLKSLVITDEDELNRIIYINQMFRFRNNTIGVDNYISVLGSINNTKYINPNDFDTYIRLIVNNGFDINVYDIKHDRYKSEITKQGNMLTYLEDNPFPEKEFFIEDGSNSLPLTNAAMNALLLKEQGIDDKHKPDEIEVIRSANAPPLYHLPITSRNQRVPFGYIHRPRKYEGTRYLEETTKRQGVYDVLQALARMNARQRLSFAKLLTDDNVTDDFYDFSHLITEELMKYDSRNPYLGNKTISGDSNGENKTLGQRLLLEDKKYQEKYQGGGKKLRKRTNKKKRKKSRKRTLKRRV